MIPDLYLAPERDKPEVDFKFSLHHLSLKGETYQENAAQFYGPILAALRVYLNDTRGAHITVNDNHGHPCGDKLLQNLADLVQESLGPEDRLGRFGGEEFVIILRQPSLIVCKGFAERLRRHVELTPFDGADQVLHITLSFGLVLCQPGDSFEEVYRRADQALYAAKRNGRNRVEVAE